MSELIEEAQEMLYTWEGLLRSTGGALHPDKSYWYLVDVVWKNGHWTFTRKNKVQGELQLYNNGDPKTATKLDVSEAKEALGIQTRPDCNMKDQFTYLKKKAIKQADSMHTKKPPPHVVWYSLTHCIMKTIEYPLLTTTLSREQTKQIMTPILKIALPLCGVQQKMPEGVSWYAYCLPT